MDENIIKSTKTPAQIADEAKIIAKKWVEIKYPHLKVCDESKRCADIVAKSDDEEKYYFEVKGTEKDSNNFGAATLTECSCAVDAKHYSFLLVNINKTNLDEAVQERTLEEMFEYMSVPPFKINFNIRKCKRKNKKEKADGSAVVDKKLIKKMKIFYDRSIKRIPKNNN